MDAALRRRLAVLVVDPGRGARRRYDAVEVHILPPNTPAEPANLPVGGPAPQCLPTAHDAREFERKRGACVRRFGGSGRTRRVVVEHAKGTLELARSRNHTETLASTTNELLLARGRLLVTAQRRDSLPPALFPSQPRPVYAEERAETVFAAGERVAATLATLRPLEPVEERRGVYHAVIASLDLGHRRGCAPPGDGDARALVDLVDFLLQA